MYYKSNRSPKNIVDVICSLENGTDEKTSSEIFYKKGLDLIRLQEFFVTNLV